MHRVIVLDNLAQDGLDILEATEGIEYKIQTGLAGQKLADALQGFDAAICRSGVKLTAEVLEGQTTLKAIARAGVGTDNIDKAAATRAGIVVMNTPAGNTLSTAEHTIAMLLALSRNIVPAYQGLVEGRWDRKKFMGSQLAGKTLGVIGLGRIGQAVAARARAFEMNVLGYDPFLSADRAKELHITLEPNVDGMLPLVDYLTVHTPLNDETRGMISDTQMDMLRPSARLINCARGGIYDEAALARGLEAGKIAGVALDVFTEEPCTDSPLFGMPGVIATPHLAASTEEAQTEVAREAVTHVLTYLQTGAIRHAVNVAPLDADTLASLGGYLDIAYRLGLFMADLHEGRMKQCRLLFRGEVAEKKTGILTSMFTAGLLQNAMDEEVNLINAQLILQERGIELVEERCKEMGAFRSSMKVEIVTEQETHTATSTLFGQNMPRLVELNGYRLEAFMDGCLLVFSHHDVPGIIGTVGTIMGSHNVNIAQMAVGREGESQGGAAIGVLNLDGEPPRQALDEVLNHSHIETAKVVQLPKQGEHPSWLQV